MKYLIIYNPTSGSRVLKTKIHEKVALSLLSVGHEVRMVSTEYAGHATKIASEACQSDIDVVCAIGGDGTINEIASTLIGSNKMLGIIPNGSGNGLARELNIPLNIDQAIEQLLAHSVSTIDTCSVNGKPFFCTCGIGFDGSVSEEFSESSVRGPLVYIKDAIQTFFSHTPAIYQIKIDDKEITTKAFLIAFANAAQYGNNAFIAPRASLTDGLIDITVIKAFPIVDAAQVAIQLFSKGLEKSPYTELYRGREVSVTTDKPIPYHIDGEAMGATDHIKITLLPQSLKVISGDISSTQGDRAFLSNLTNNVIGWHNDLMSKLGIRHFNQHEDPK